MNHHGQLPIAPTEAWGPNPEEVELDEQVRRAVRIMNSKDSEELVDNLKSKVQVSENGIAYAVLKGNNEGEYSEEEALVVFNPFANAATPNMLVRAEFVREVAANYDIRDDEGKLKPVIMLASPGIGGSALSLTSEERAEVRGGELGPAASELLKVVARMDVGRVSLLGFSQGADMALAGARTSYSENLDTDAIAVGDPASVEDRSKRQLVGDFGKAGARSLKEAVNNTGLEAQSAALGSGVADFARFGASAMLPVNQMLYSGLGKNTFESRIREILDEGVVEKIVVGYGGDSAIAKPYVIEPAIERIYHDHGADSLVSIRVNGAKHTWGDQLTLLSKLYMRALQ